MSKKNKFLFFSIFSVVITFIINKIIILFSTINNNLYSNNNYYYQWRFGQIHYTKQGNGEPLLLIHTLSPMNCGIEWKNLIQELKKDYTIYTIDLIGCGRSEKPKLTYTSFLYVQLLNDFIKNVIKEPTNIISSGLSCSFTTMACYQNPKDFKKLLFINPISINTLLNYPKKTQKIKKFIIELPILGTLIYNVIFSKYNIKHQLKHNLYTNKKRVNSKMVNLLHESSHINGENARYLFSSIFNQYVNINITSALKSINNSIYIVSGEDILDSNKIIESYHQINSSIETSLIKNTKYLPHVESPKQIIEICRIYFV